MISVRPAGQVIVQSLHRLGRWGDMTDDSAEILFHSFLQKALVSSSGMGRNIHFDVVCPTFPLTTPTALPNLQGALEDGFGEAVVVCDVPEPCACMAKTTVQFSWT